MQQDPRRPELATIVAWWNGQEIIVAIEGIVAHGPGGNQGKFLVL
jgi:hypothetical protein